MTEPTSQAPTSSDADATPSGTDAATPKVSVHRWPWRTEEYVSIVVVEAIIIGLGYFVFTTTAEALSSAAALAFLITVAVSALAAPYYLYRVKKKRTDTSQVTITIIGNVVRSESKGPLGKSQGDLTKTKTVSYRRYNSDETFMIGNGETSLRIPVRATSNRDVRDAVETAFATAEHVADEARDLFNRMPAVTE